MGILFIVWGPFGFRADELAQAINATRVNITILYGPRYYAPIRYLFLFFKTLFLLAQERPRIVFAQNPPIFCPFACLIYACVTGTRLLVDHHSIWQVKTLRGPIGRVIGFLEKFVALSAYANTAPHSEWGESLREMGGRRVSVIHDYVPSNPYSRDDSIRRKYSSAGVISIAAHGGHPLEMMEMEAAAAARVKGLALLITGPQEKLSGRLERMSSLQGVRYLGFLPREEYERLKAACDFALNVTTEPHTLSHVLFEFAASRLPIIASRQAVVEEIFGDSIQYLDTNNVEEVVAVLKRFTEDAGLRATFRGRIIKKHAELTELRERELASLRALLRP
jgi:glycosyltransferase involved in cell wall biosynthesis